MEVFIFKFVTAPSYTQKGIKFCIETYVVLVIFAKDHTNNKGISTFITGVSPSNNNFYMLI